MCICIIFVIKCQQQREFKIEKIKQKLRSPKGEKTPRDDRGNARHKHVAAMPSQSFTFSASDLQKRSTLTSRHFAIDRSA